MQNNASISMKKIVFIIRSPFDESKDETNCRLRSFSLLFLDFEFYDLLMIHSVYEVHLFSSGIFLFITHVS